VDELLIPPAPPELLELAVDELEVEAPPRPEDDEDELLAVVCADGELHAPSAAHAPKALTDANLSAARAREPPSEGREGLLIGQESPRGSGGKPAGCRLGSYAGRRRFLTNPCLDEGSCGAAVAQYAVSSTSPQPSSRLGSRRLDCR
jgi:hypothetical protein